MPVDFYPYRPKVRKFRPRPIDKVSIDDIIRVSNDIFNLDRLNIAIIGNTNEKNAEVYIKKYLKGFDDKKLYL